MLPDSPQAGLLYSIANRKALFNDLAGFQVPAEDWCVHIQVFNIPFYCSLAIIGITINTTIQTAVVHTDIHTFAATAAFSAD